MRPAEVTSVAESEAILAGAPGPPDSAQPAIPMAARTYRRRPFTYSAERAARLPPLLPLAPLKTRPQ